MVNQAGVLYLSNEAWNDMLDNHAAEVVWRERRHRRAEVFAASPGDVRRFYGWTRRRWARERRRYNAKRSWWGQQAWAAYVTSEAAKGDPPWHKRKATGRR